MMNGMAMVQTVLPNGQVGWMLQSKAGQNQNQNTGPY